MKTHIGAQSVLQLCCEHPNTKNTESVEPELKNVVDKYQKKWAHYLFHHHKCKMKQNYWYNLGIPPPSSRKVKQGHLDEFQFFPFIVINNITVPFKEVRRWYEWFVSELKNCKNYSIASFNYSVDKRILNAEVNAYGIISMPII